MIIISSVTQSKTGLSEVNLQCLLLEETEEGLTISQSNFLSLIEWLRVFKVKKPREVRETKAYSQWKKK